MTLLKFEFSEMWQDLFKKIPWQGRGMIYNLLNMIQY